jgi:hypothetical protein
MKAGDKYIYILTCTDSGKWYSEKIGWMFPLLQEDKTEYETRQSSGYINYVQKKDAVILEVIRELNDC